MTRAGKKPESFTVELSNPTGGAILGDAHERHRDDRLPTISRGPEGRGGGGGGATGWLSLLLLGLAAFVRRTWRLLPDRA